MGFRLVEALGASAPGGVWERGGEMAQPTGTSWQLCQGKGSPYIAAAPYWQRVCTIKEQADAGETRANAQLIVCARPLLRMCEILTQALEDRAYLSEASVLHILQQAYEVIAETKRQNQNKPRADLECANEDCGWTGPIDETVHPKHDAALLLCPECYEVVE